MKEVIKIFNEEKIRVKIIKGEPYFSLIDCCKILDIKNPSDALTRIEKDDLVNTETIDRFNRRQFTTFLNEGALYQLIFTSRKDEAKEFKKWVTHEVLPSIRKTGKYSIPEQVKKISTQKRTELTDEWQTHGIEKPHEYIQLTLQEYKSLGFEKGKRKKELSRGEMLLLSALESMEALKLFNNDEINGYSECKGSLHKTAKLINNSLEKS